MQTLLVAKGLTKKYKHINAVNEASIEIHSGCFHVIMGRSGSGKTTLLSLMGLLDTPTSGDLWIEGKSIATLSNNEKAHIRMKDFGFVFQEYHLNPVMRAYENVMLPMYINPVYKDVDKKEKAIELLDLLELKDRYKHFPSQLSGGEQQRVAIARALANNPKCIFADEPTGNLDIQSEKIVLESLKKLTKNGQSIVLVSHNEAILEYADKVFYMSEGNIEERMS